MTEKEKMVKGLIYDANYDEELSRERNKAKEIFYDYNMLKPLDYKEKNNLMVHLLGKVGNEFCIMSPFWCDYGYNIELGENFFFEL